MGEIVPWILVTILLSLGAINNKLFHIGDDVNKVQKNQFIIITLAIVSVIRTTLLILEYFSV